MRSAEEQRRGLRLLRAPKGAFIRQLAGDVVALVAGDREVVFAVGGYDGWVGGHIKRTDMSADQAERFLRGAMA